MDKPDLLLSPNLASESGSAAFQNAVEALIGIRNGLARVIEELPDVRRPADLERALGVDRPLAWRVFRTATAHEPPQILQYLPTTNQLTRVLRIVRKCGVSGSKVDAVQETIARFEECVRATAGDRASFVALLSGHLKQGQMPLEQRVRRDAFRANAHLWGNQCRTLAFLAVLNPSIDGRSLNSFTVRGWVDLHSSRPERSIMLFSRFQIGKDPSSDSTPRDTRLAGSLDVISGAGSVRDLSLTTIDNIDGQQETHIRLPSVGREGRISTFVRQHFEHVQPIHIPFSMMHVVCLPAEMIVFDLLTPPGWADPTSVKAFAYARPHQVHSTSERRSVDAIPIFEEPMCTPGVTNVTHSPDIKHWPELVKPVMMERGWFGSTFDHYRLRIPFPMLHSAVGIDLSPRVVGRKG